MNIFVAIPVYDGKIPARLALGLLKEQQLALGAGDNFKVAILSSNAGVISARNQLVRQFLESDSDKLFFLDSDITFPEGALVKLCHKPVEIVGGCYRHKNPNEVSYPVCFLKQDELYGDANGLTEVAQIPTGFMSIDRSVFKKIDEKFPERRARLGNAVNYFQMPVVDGILYGEDFYFCKEWTEQVGGKVFMDPDLDLVHWCFNPVAYPGHIGKWLRGKNPQDYNYRKGDINELPEKHLSQGL